VFDSIRCFCDACALWHTLDSSALFVLVKSVTEDKVLAEIEHYKPRVLKTSLSNEDEAKLKTALSKAA
jgi:uncharacterized membrane protein